MLKLLQYKIMNSSFKYVLSLNEGPLFIHHLNEPFVFKNTLEFVQFLIAMMQRPWATKPHQKH
jgi:hypothetical protein